MALVRIIQSSGIVRARQSAHVLGCRVNRHAHVGIPTLDEWPHVKVNCNKFFCHGLRWLTLTVVGVGATLRREGRVEARARAAPEELKVSRQVYDVK